MTDSKLLASRTDGIEKSDILNRYNDRHPDLLHLQNMLRRGRVPNNVNLSLVGGKETNFTGTKTYVVRLAKYKEVAVQAQDPHELQKKVKRDHKNWEISEFRTVIRESP